MLEMPRLAKKWFALLLGAGAGLSYGLCETMLDKYFLKENSNYAPLHDLIEWTVPVLIGITLSLVILVYQHQKELNAKLSGEVSGLKSRILTNTFASYILHEIRNPIHNLNAVVEKNREGYPEDERQVLDRNMKKLAGVTDQLKNMHMLSDHLDVRQPLAFKPWLATFLNDSVFSDLRKSKLRYTEQVHPLSLSMHPLLLEQCFMLLFDNALRAAVQSEEGLIDLSAVEDSEKPGFARIVLSNSGEPFSEDITRAAGRARVASREGSGLGLVLARDTMKHVGGELIVENRDGHPRVILSIPLERTPQ